MNQIINPKSGFWQALSLGLVLLVSGPACGEIAPLDNFESDGYLQWLHSLEQAVIARENADAPEGNLLFPFDQPGWEVQDHRPYRHLAISKAIIELEAQWLLRGESREESALVALAHARNYTNLSEFDSAMVWFQAAAKLDSLGLFHREIGREHMAAANAAGDSLTISQLITNTLGSPDLTGRDQEVILAYRWLLTGRDSETLEILLTKVESQPQVMSERMIFWHAYSLAWLERRAESLQYLRTLIKSGGLSKDLSEAQRAWVLLAIPDLMFLQGDQEQSSSLYLTLADSGLDHLRHWGLYQVANLDFLNGRYGKAAIGFDLVCAGSGSGSWQDQACDLADIARQLENIRTEGEPYGTAQYFQP